MEKGSQFEVLSVGTHNINRVKTNRSKMNFVIEYIKKTNIDILGLVETNMSEKERKLMFKKVQGYHGFWLLANKDKVKGSGVGLIINSK